LALVTDALERLDVVLEADLQDLDVPAPPQPLLEVPWILLDRPRREPVLERLLPPDAVEDDAQVPVLQAVAEEQEMAPVHQRHEARRDDLADVGLGEEGDVVVLGYDIAVAGRIGTVDRSVDLENDVAPFQ